MKKEKIKKIEKIKEVLDLQFIKDKKEKKKKSRSLDVWLLIINRNLPPIHRLVNNRELASIFRFFNFEKDSMATTSQGCFRRINFYKYLGGMKNGKN